MSTDLLIIIHTLHLQCFCVVRVSLYPQKSARCMSLHFKVERFNMALLMLNSAARCLEWVNFRLVMESKVFTFYGKTGCALLQDVFPSCNVARMVELLPEGFLQQSQQSMVRKVAAINHALRDSLPGANIDMMVQEDPTILFEDKHSLSTGLRELHDLWDVDETALGNSNPWELALAIRTMSDQEPPDTI